MLINKKGDLLKSNCTVIMHQANCFSTMGAGIAKSIVDLYPKVAEVDYKLQLSKEERFGKYSKVTLDNNLTVVNLYGQFHYGSGRKQTNYKKLENAIDLFIQDAKKNKNIDLTKIGVPYKMGCGLAGGNWEQVEKILERQSKKHSVDIYIYKL